MTGRSFCVLIKTMLLLCVMSNAYGQMIIPYGSSLNITFGEGRPNPGSPLPEGYTDFPYTADSCPSPGHYTVANRTYFECFAGTWISKTSDHSPYSNFGYMMVVNDTPTSTTKTVFRDTIKKALCGDVTYQFSAWVINLESETFCSSNDVRFPHLTFNVESSSGVILQSFHTGSIPYAADLGPPKYPFTQYGVQFTMPAAMPSFVVKILDDSSGYTPCGYAFAIDDIQVLPLGPDLFVSLTGRGPNIVATSVCYKNNTVVSMTGSIGPGFIDPAIQWQQSSDNGNVWTDIPGAMGLVLAQPYSIPDTLLLRMRGSEAHNISNPNCSVVSNVIRLDVDRPPTDFIFTSNEPVCTDGDLIFELAGGASYVTTGPNGFYDNSPFPHIADPVHADSGWYYSQIVTLGGCISTDSTHVRINGPDIRVSDDTAVCYGSTVPLIASGGITYSWTPASGLSDAGIADPVAVAERTTKYTIKITDGTACTASGHVTITLLNNILKAAFSGPEVVCPNDIAAFADQSQGDIVTWNWDLGNGQTSLAQSPPEQQYPAIGQLSPYTVRLAITDTAGCSDTLSKIVQSADNCHIEVPSAFTPNQDGHNDYMYPLNAYKATDLIFRVYNRAGQLVFESRDRNKKWDGKVNGVLQPEGTFIWTLSYRDADAGNRQVSVKGTTVLIR